MSFELIYSECDLFFLPLKGRAILHYTYMERETLYVAPFRALSHTSAHDSRSILFFSFIFFARKNIASMWFEKKKKPRKRI